jgi:pimeloyl-ACP methyl ester carboxylesterase
MDGAPNFFERSVTEVLSDQLSAFLPKSYFPEQVALMVCAKRARLPPSPYSCERLRDADDLAELVTALDLLDAIHAGHSTGGGEIARYIGRSRQSQDFSKLNGRLSASLTRNRRTGCLLV